MSIEQLYRDTVETMTRDRAGGPDLAAAIASGRRRRRVRRTAAVGAGVGVLAVAAVGGLALSHDSSSVAVDSGPSAAPAFHDFVPGSDVDEAMQATVAQHLPDVGAATDVYPSDWNHSGPIDRFADATEWHATYDVSGTESLRLVLSDPIPGEPATVGCDGLVTSDVPCRRTDLPDGSTIVRSGYVLDGTTYRFMTVHVARDGSVAETLDDVQAGSWQEAAGARALTDGELAALVEDPALTFPAPEHTPPSPQPER